MNGACRSCTRKPYRCELYHRVEAKLQLMPVSVTVDLAPLTSQRAERSAADL